MNNRILYFGISLFLGSFFFLLPVRGAELSTLGASTFLGGANGDVANDIIVDTAGNVFVVGVTNSQNFPLSSSPYDTTYTPFETDIFVSKLSSNLQILLGSTFLGGSGKDIGQAIALDSTGNVYITGFTISGDFPVTSGIYDSTHNGWEDAFVTKLSPNLQTILASTYLASTGFGTDKAQDIAINSNGDVYVVGNTDSTDFPIVGGTYDSTFAG
ncbi:MAG: SBBP repeat-containing protein, partial [Candidatus Magasanikbacteria bacterium]|nr:SBBP repeat-containing protein [Candidatus Magasanikbacteria bacterium]